MISFLFYAIATIIPKIWEPFVHYLCNDCKETIGVSRKQHITPIPNIYLMFILAQNFLSMSVSAVTIISTSMSSPCFASVPLGTLSYTSGYFRGRRNQQVTWRNRYILKDCTSVCDGMVVILISYNKSKFHITLCPSLTRQ